MIYYNRNQTIVRTSEPSDVDYLRQHLKATDIKEIWRSNHKTPLEALTEGFYNSTICLTIQIKSEPVAMFGIVPETLIGSKASIWMLSTDKLREISKSVARNSRDFINMFLSYYSLLYNHIDIENTESMKWLAWCGAEFADNPEPYGIEQTDFLYFQFRRRNV